MDENIVRVLAEAYDETVTDVLARGRSPDIAPKEGVTAAAMFLASLTGVEDASARREVEALGLKPT